VCRLHYDAGDPMSVRSCRTGEAAIALSDEIFLIHVTICEYVAIANWRSFPPLYAPAPYALLSEFDSRKVQ